MIGVTVSIFGAQKTRSPLASFGMALVYVLGLATMYSTLGVIAALSGGLFGSALQSPVVSVGIGVLLIGLALSMFGLYQLQPPAWVLSRFGGVTATSMVGAFFSGMLVGIFAAPCVGPPVVALLAVVGAKGDPWFGFLSFFTLSMGLGLPYLVLGTFSGLMRRLPRSGEWMIWVERLFGVILFSVGLFYALLALAPGLAAWVAPVALLVGGIYLGFIERSTSRWPGFPWLKRIAGTAAVVLAVILTRGLSRAGATFEAYSPPAVQSALASGNPVLLDFSADWCIPCRELEHITFKDPRVLGESRRFRMFRVDLTRFDSAEAESLRTQWKIHGVPTIVFLTRDGREIPGARVEGFLEPETFLQRMKAAGSG
jgi:thiol:disulfide interchange protein DsbD